MNDPIKSGNNEGLTDTMNDPIKSAINQALNAAIVGSGTGESNDDVFWARLGAELQAAKAKEMEA
jgi:hypothetical protein